MSSIDRNDVDITKLFYWSDKFEIKNLKGDVVLTVYMRLPGDAEVNQAKVFGLRHSKELRGLLKSDTDERSAFIPEFEELEMDVLVNYITTYKMSEFAKDSANMVNIPYPTELKSDATVEEQERFQTEVDTYDTRRDNAYREFITKRIEEYQSELRNKDITYVRKLAESVTIVKLCEDAMIGKFKEYLVFISIYKDNKFKTKLFSNFNDFDNLPSEIKNQFKDCYDSLELGSIELKK